MRIPPRLNDEQRKAFLDRLANTSSLYSDMLHSEPTDVEPLPTPDVLDSVRAYRVVIHARRRPVELTVAEVDGSDLILLGEPSRVVELAQRVGLTLRTQDEVAEYARFWCTAALRHTEHLVESSADFRWIPGVTTDADLRAHADRAAHLARRVVVGHPAGGAFPVEVTVLEQRTLELRRLRVTDDGRVDEVERVELAEDVPVPYTMP